ncbi:hypothetical protein [Polaromonas sp. UC242_47]|uniref:hypothetical protein n=1 Tax=Polaromonas sp. UC242_47 TaxID=3374626 RepID=UPI00378F0193
MKNVIKALFAALAIAVLSGCATSLDKTATTVDWTKGSVVALSVELHNEYKPNYHPTHLGVVMIKKTGTDSRQRIPAFSAIPAGTNAYLVTQQIQPGQYTLSKIYGMSQKFPIMGGIDFAIDAPFEVAPNSVIYLGRIAAVNKERANKDDQSTGGIIPLIDQAISGYGSGTLSVVLKDNYDEDVKVLKREFIAVEKHDVIRSPLKTMKLERTTGSTAALIEVNLPTAVVATQDAPTPTLPVTGK